MMCAQDMKWLLFFVDTELDKELRAILLDPKILEAVNRASKNATSELEGFHSCLNRNAPKMEGFSYAGMISRLVILLHWVQKVVSTTVAKQNKYAVKQCEPGP